MRAGDSCAIAVAAAFLTAVAGCGGSGHWRAWGDRTRCENQYYRIRGHSDWQLVFRDKGPRDAPLTLLFLHGAASSKYSWVEVASRLEDRHRVILVDLLGHGDSSKPLEFSYHMEDQAAIIRDFIRDQNLH